MTKGDVKEKNAHSNDHLWWLRMLLGIAAIFFGITSVVWPGLTLVTLVYLFSTFILAWGLIELITGLLHVGKRGNWWLSLLFGVIGLGIGVYLLRNPYVSFQTFILLAGLALIARGIFEFVGSFMDKDPDTAVERTLAVVTGAAAVFAGIVLLFQPVTGGVALVWIIGLYALVMGAVCIVQALTMYERLKNDR